MHLRKLFVLTCWFFIIVPASATLGQDRYNPEAMLGPQREAMKKLAHMNGTWRGPAWTIVANGQKHHITQTERIGPFLDGTLKVIEGRGYEPDGKVTFNAMGIISYDLEKKHFTMRSYAQGYSGDFVLTLSDNGYSWEVPAGPSMTMRYTATIKDGVWKEVGDRIIKGKEAVRFFEMELKRVGDSDWPVAGTVPPK